MTDLTEKLRVASIVIGNLPELPGYNGSILTIDDTEAAEIESALDESIAVFQSVIQQRDELLAALVAIVTAWEEGRALSGKANEIGNARAAIANAERAA